MNRLSLFFLSGLISLSFSCTRDPESDPDGGGERDSTELPGRVIQRFFNDSIVATGRGGSFTMQADLDGDGTGDLEFGVDSWSQLSGAGWSFCTVRPVNGSYQVSVAESADTTFLSISYRFLEAAYFQKQVAINIIRTHTCRRLLPGDSVLETSRSFRPVAYSEENKGLPGGIWSGEQLYLRNRSGYGPGISFEREVADTIWVGSMEKVTGCLDFPDTTAYLGIRKLTGEKEKYGWIKLLVRGGFIRVFESQLQR